MKITCFRWHLALPLAAAIAGFAPAARGQQVQPTAAVDIVELAIPYEATPVEPAPLLRSTDDDNAPLEPIPADETAAGDASQDTGAEVHSPAITSQTTTEAHVEDEADSGEPREIIKERYANGSVRSERETIQDAEGNYLRHGRYRELDASGSVIVEGRYKRDQRTGVWRRVHDGKDSALFSTAPYKEFAGPFVSQAGYRDGVLHGKWVISDSRQRKISEIEYIDGQRSGKAQWFHPNGAVLTEITYEADRVHGDVIKFNNNGETVATENYQHGRRVAPKAEYYENKSKKQETEYLHAMLFMQSPDDWDAAKLATFEARGNDERHGALTMWHPNGQISRQAEFRYNLPVGKAVYWFDNGQKQIEGEFVDGRQHGDWTWWHNNGQKAIVGHYAEGRAVGNWIWWNGSGKVAQKVDYSAGRRSAPVARLNPPTPLPDHGAALELRPAPQAP